MGRGGAKNSEQGLRRCLINGNGQPRAGLVRFVLHEGQVYPDINEKLPGRGVWLSSERPIIEEAIKKKAFSRAFRQDVHVDDNFIEQIESGVKTRLISLLSIARKSGVAIAGADKVGDVLRAGYGVGLLQARDGSERGKRNIGDRSLLEWQYEVLTSAELGKAFGRDLVIHTVLTGNPLTNSVYAEATRLAGLMTSK